ncbi:MAG: hypothetical protein Q9188_007315 [Gyalolechia gomerana]
MSSDDKTDQELTTTWLQWPAHVPPSRTTSTDGDNPSLQKYNILCQTICLTLVTILLLPRIYTKGRILKNLGWDDFTSVIAWVGLIVFGCVLFQQDRHGAGKHIWDIQERDYSGFIKWIKAGDVVYFLTILVAKASILLLYLRVFHPSRTMRIIIHINLWINIIVCLIGFGSGMSWFIGSKTTGKVDGRALGLCSGAFNVASDIAILIIPISMVWTLQMSRQRKLAVSAVFATGTTGCVASSVRMGLYVKGLKGYSDPTWQTYPEQLWSYAEISAGIMCGCMPVVPRFWRHIRECFGKKPTDNSDGPQHDKNAATYRFKAIPNEPRNHSRLPSP